MTMPEILGYATAILLIAGFAMKTITWVRGLAIAAGLVLVAYAIVVKHPGLLVIALALVIFNVWRLLEMRRLVAMTKEATAASGGPISIDWLLPYMRPVDVPQHHVLFRKGDVADAMYFVADGRVRFDEIGVEIGKGNLFGEIGIFSADQVRTAGAICVDPCSLLAISAERVRELYFQNPEFGFYLVGLITRRLMEDLTHARPLKP